MKAVIKINAILFLGIAMLLIDACKKEGPVGPKGDTGPVGQNGQTNVSSTTFTMSTWSYTSPYYYRNIGVPSITANNVDSALVMVYFSTVGSNWFALPYTQYNSPFDYYMGFEASAGQVQVTWVYDTSTSSGSDPNTYYGTTVKCKVVVVPPAHRKANPNINWHNYSEVKAKFKLKD